MFQFRRFPTYCYFIHSTLTRYCRAGFPRLTFVVAISALFASGVSQRLSPKAHTAPLAPPLKSETGFRFVLGRGGFAIELQLLDRYGLIAVLRIMQALQKICALLCVTLKVPHYVAVAVHHAQRPLLPCLISSSSVQFSRCRTGSETGTKYSKRV